MVMEAVAMVQKRFYDDYPPHPKEKEYNYKCSSTMKPTQMQVIMLAVLPGTAIE